MNAGVRKRKRLALTHTSSRQTQLGPWRNTPGNELKVGEAIQGQNGRRTQTSALSLAVPRSSPESKEAWLRVMGNSPTRRGSLRARNLQVRIEGGGRKGAPEITTTRAATAAL